MRSYVKRLANESPPVFALAVTAGFLFLVVLSAAVANRWPAESPGWYASSAAGRAAAIALLLLLLWRLGWLRAAGLTRFGRRPLWLVTILLLPYVALAPLYAMTGRFDLPAGLPALSGPAALFYVAHAFLEEVVFRGLVLVALAAAWGNSTSGLVKSVVIASLFFAAMHLLNVFGGNPLPIVLLQSAGAFFLGILFGSLVLGGDSLYPAALLHAAANVAAYLSLAASPGAAVAAPAWLLQSALIVPLAVAGLAHLRGMSEPIANMEVTG